MRRALTSWGFVVGAAGMAAAAFFGVLEEIIPVFQGQMEGGLPPGYSIQLTITSLKSEVMLLVLPILCALPFTTAFVDDYKSKYLRGYLCRAGRRDYTISRVTATAVSGGMTLLVGVALICVLFSIVFTPMEVVVQETDTAALTQSVEEIDVSAQVTFVDLLGRALLFFLSGALWSLVGALLATATMSKYMAYASPFIFYYVLVILSDRYFPDVYVLNPREWLNPSELWNAGIWGAVLLVLELIVILSALYALFIQRRLRDV